MFMSYLTLKKWRNYEWRLYPDNSKIEGQILYRGHKMGVDSNTLLEILDVKTTNNNEFEILKYNEGDLNDNRKKVWIKTNKSGLLKTLIDCWDSALNKLESVNAISKKIVITKLFV